MGDLDAPDSVAEIYDSRADEVSLARLVFQGDIFEGVVMRGLSDEPRRVMVMSHPCSMRAGPRLKPHLVVASVESGREIIPLNKWRGSHYAKFPLPEVAAQNGDHLFADFSLIATVRSSDLDRHLRIACLSERGIQLLQQRHVFYLTRVKVDLFRIHQQLAPNFAEAELGQEWVEAAVDLSDSDALDRIDAAEADFDAFLRQEDRRGRLGDETRRSGVRREVRTEIARRFKSETAE